MFHGRIPGNGNGLQVFRIGARSVQEFVRHLLQCPGNPAAHFPKTFFGRGGRLQAREHVGAELPLGIGPAGKGATFSGLPVHEGCAEGGGADVDGYGKTVSGSQRCARGP